jgi:hypothetical protein
LTLTGVAIPIHITMNWNPSFSYAVMPAGMTDVPDYYKVLATPVPEAQGLPHFRNVHIWNVKATGARQAFNVSAYAAAPLEYFHLDRLEIEAATAGTIANAKSWRMEDNNIQTADDGQVKFTDATGTDPRDVPYGDRYSEGAREREDRGRVKE